jgi:myo-inositol-1(or 4)-monophosphatase
VAPLRRCPPAALVAAHLLREATEPSSTAALWHASGGSCRSYIELQHGMPGEPAWGERCPSASAPAASSNRSKRPPEQDTTRCPRRQRENCPAPPARELPRSGSAATFHARMNDLELAIAIAEVGASVVRRRFGSTLQRFDKGAGDFATNADIEAENAMLELLRRERPEDAVVGEESGRSGASEGSRVWLLDPLCGTLNFAARMRVAAVNVALRAKDRFIAAAVADPFNAETFWTDGMTASLRAGSEESRLVPSASSTLVDLNLDPPFPSAPRFRAVLLAAHPEFATPFRPRVVSTSMALTWVASGQRAAYITDGDVRGSVHFAAGIALCEASGCLVTDLRGQAWGNGPTGLLVAADAQTHAALLRIIAKCSAV